MPKEVFFLCDDETRFNVFGKHIAKLGIYIRRILKRLHFSIKLEFQDRVHESSFCLKCGSWFDGNSLINHLFRVKVDESTVL